MQSLHNLAELHPESKDHAAEQPEKVNELLVLHRQWAKEVNSK